MNNETERIKHHLLNWKNSIFCVRCLFARYVVFYKFYLNKLFLKS